MADFVEALAVPEPPVARWVREHLRWPERLAVSEWVEKHISMSSRLTSEPGRVDLSRTPHLREIMDSAGTTGVRKITLKKCTQSGGTQAMQWMLCHAIVQDPGPAMMVMATEDGARKTSKGRMLPLLRENRCTRALMPRGGYDVTRLQYSLRTMDVYLAWSNSPSALASFPIRYFFADEINKYPKFSGKEADPLKLGGERTATYWNRLEVHASTPTVPGAYIDREYAESDRREFMCPCPHCGHYQALTFRQIRWPKDERNPSRIEGMKMAWYVCAECEERIEEHQRRAMVSRGVWCPDGCTVDKHGNVSGSVENTAHRGYWWNKLVMPPFGFSTLAAEFLRSKEKPEKLMNFVNSWLAEEWEEKADGHAEIVIGDAEASTPGLGWCPAWAFLVTAGVDVQQDYLRVVVRAWGLEERSWLLYEDRLRAPSDDDADFEEEEDGADAEASEDEWSQLEGVLGMRWETPDGRELGIHQLLIDGRYRQDEVLAFARRHSESVMAAQGANTRMAAPYQLGHVDKIPGRRGRRKQGLPYLRLDTNYYKSLMARMAAEGGWGVPRDVSAAYMREVQAERKVIHRDTLGKPSVSWELKPGYRDNHALDSEMMATAAADWKGYWRDAEELAEALEVEAKGAGDVAEWFGE